MILQKPFNRNCIRKLHRKRDYIRSFFLKTNTIRFKTGTSIDFLNRRRLSIGIVHSPVMSCHGCCFGVSSRVLSCRVISCLFVSGLVEPCPVTSSLLDRVTSGLVISSRVMSGLVLSCHAMA